VGCDVARQLVGLHRARDLRVRRGRHGARHRCRSRSASSGCCRGLGIFAPLPIATIETLAARLDHVTVEAGDVIVRDGADGDRCYVVAEGEIALSKHSGWATAMGPGGFFGELALLRDAPRNATVVATEPGLLLALERSEFLAAVTGHARTQEAADALVRERVGAA
jgi:CRP-like cAMP-binding protein